MISAAVVGLGWWGRKIVTDLSDSDHIRVAIGVDPSDSARSQTSLPTVRELETVLHDPSIDAVILCSPHQAHVDQVVAAAAAGKHVFCEKPLASTVEKAKYAIDAVARAGLVLGIGHERRFEPAVLALREALASGKLGKPLVFEGNFSQDKFLSLEPTNWRLSNEHAPVGPLSATGIHLVDLAIAILGRPESVWARLSTQATSFENGDTLTATMAFPHGQTALITAVLTTPFTGRVAVLCSEGWMEIRDRRHPEDPAGWDVTTTLRGQEPTTTFYPPHPSVRANLDAFALAVEGHAAYPVPPAEILANIRAFEALTRSAASGLIEPV